MFFLLTKKPNSVVCSPLGGSFKIHYAGDDYFDHLCETIFSREDTPFAVVTSDDTEYTIITHHKDWTHEIVNESGETFIEI